VLHSKSKRKFAPPFSRASDCARDLNERV